MITASLEFRLSWQIIADCMQLNGLYTQQLGSYEFQFLREVVKEFYLLKIFVFLTRTYKQDV